MFPCHTVTRPHSKKVCKLVLAVAEGRRVKMQKSEAKSSSWPKSTQMLKSNSFKIKLFYYFFITWRSFSFIFSCISCATLLFRYLYSGATCATLPGNFLRVLLSGYFVRLLPNLSATFQSMESLARFSVPSFESKWFASFPWLWLFQGRPLVCLPN